MTRFWPLVTMVLVACAGRGAAPPEPAIQPEPVATEVPDAADEPEPAHESPPSGRPFADSPLSGFANVMTDAILAALEGEPLPQLPLPTQMPVDPAVPQVQFAERRGEQAEPVGEVTAVAFLFEVEVIYKVGDRQPDVPREANLGRVGCVLFLSRHGLRLVTADLETLTPRRPTPLPAALSGVEQATTELLETLRQGNIDQAVIGDDERRLVDNPEFWADIQREIPSGQDLEELVRFLETVQAQPVGYDVENDTGLLVRDSEGSLFGITFQLDESNGQYQLESNPVFRGFRLDN